MAAIAAASAALAIGAPLVPARCCRPGWRSPAPPSPATRWRATDNTAKLSRCSICARRRQPRRLLVRRGDADAAGRRHQRRTEPVRALPCQRLVGLRDRRQDRRHVLARPHDQLRARDHDDRSDRQPRSRAARPPCPIRISRVGRSSASARSVPAAAATSPTPTARPRSLRAPADTPPRPACSHFL